MSFASELDVLGYYHLHIMQLKLLPRRLQPEGPGFRVILLVGRLEVAVEFVDLD